MPSRKKYPRGKRALFVYISEDLYDKVRELALSQYDKFHGALSAIVEEALREYLKTHSGGAGGIGPPHAHTKSTKSANKVLKVFMQVLDFIKRQRNYSEDEVICEITESELVRAIMEVRGIDPRTIEKHLKAFQEHKLIKYDRGTHPNIVYRVLIYPVCDTV